MRLSLEAKHVKPNSIKLERFYHYIFFSQEKSGTAYCWIACSHNNGKHFLICYKGLNKNDFYKIINRPTNNDYTATSISSASINVHLLSAPEGIAFDASGNLWLGNNNDFAKTNNSGEGTLVKINKAWLNILLARVS